MPFYSVPIYNSRNGHSELAREEADGSVASNYFVSIYNSWDGQLGAYMKFSTREEADSCVASNFVLYSNGSKRWVAPRGHSQNESRTPLPPFEPVGTNSSSFPTRASRPSNGRRPAQRYSQGSPTHRKTYFFAVAIGRVPGVYGRWEEAKLQVKDFPSAKFKWFENEEDAHLYVDYYRSQGANPLDPYPRYRSTLDRRTTEERIMWGSRRLRRSRPSR